MPLKHSHPYQNAAGWLLIALSIPLLWWVSQAARLLPLDATQFVFWHSAVELFAVVVAMLVFITGYRAILSARKGAVVLLGIGFLGVALFDSLHMMSYVGMPDAISHNSPQKSTFFWLAARLLAAVTLLVYALLPPLPRVGALRRRLALTLMVSCVVLVGYAGLSRPEQLPSFFVSGMRPAALKIALEWLVVGLNILTLGIFWYRRVQLARECLLALGFAAALSAVSELFFMMSGVVDKDSADAIGHVYKVFAYLSLFHATFNEALRRPFEYLDIQRRREQVTLTAAPDGILWVSQQGTILMANPAMQQLSGYSPVELVGKNVDIFLPEHLRARHAQSMRAYFTEPHSRAMGQMDLKLMRRDGQMLPIDISLGYWENEEERHAIAYIRDLSERKKFEESLRHQATHDELTGLPNRWLFHLQLNQALARAGRSATRVAVIFLDLDYFKTVNDSFGHAAGDVLLVQVGARIRGVLRENDTLARLGGDEFAVLLTDLKDVENAVSVAEKLLISLQAPYNLQGQDIYSGGSLGLAFYPEDATDSDTLLRYADMAMYQAKATGRGAYACYSQKMDLRMHEDMTLHTRLKEAISTGALTLHYQPQIDVQSGAIVGAEALLRWHDEVLGDVSPLRFIPIAEATGLIHPLSDWVLEQACRQIASWAQSGIFLRVAVNFSSQQFRQPELSDKVRTTLARTGAKAQCLEIEITESVAMTHPQQAQEQINALVALGCSVALDDFGTGYSSLSYLKLLPISVLKIDKSFMDGIPADKNDVAICKTIMVLAHSLDLTLVAEGVETDAQLAFLQEHGCEVYQGWLCSKAMAPQVFTEFFWQRHRSLQDQEPYRIALLVDEHG